MGRSKRNRYKYKVLHNTPWSFTEVIFAVNSAEITQSTIVVNNSMIQVETPVSRRRKPFSGIVAN